MIACKKNNIKNFILASSIGVENYINNPSVYGLSKYVCENMETPLIRIFNMNIKVCKISNVFGPYSKHKTSSVHAFIKNILKRKNKIHSKGLQKRDFIFVEDVCKKLFLCTTNKIKSKEIYINTNKFFNYNRYRNIAEKISKKY